MVSETQTTEKYNLHQPASYTDLDGVVWREYNVIFSSPKGCFITTLWATSDEGAEVQLQALKETGRIGNWITKEKPT